MAESALRFIAMSSVDSCPGRKSDVGLERPDQPAVTRARFIPCAVKTVVCFVTLAPFASFANETGMPPLFGSVKFVLVPMRAIVRTVCDHSQPKLNLLLQLTGFPLPVCKSSGGKGGCESMSQSRVVSQSRLMSRLPSRVKFKINGLLSFPATPVHYSQPD